MALRPRHSVCVVCGTLVFKDVTGLYDATTNPGGYGDPNPAFGDTTPYTVSFTPPGAKDPALTIDLNAEPPDPDADGHRKWTVNPSDIGVDLNKSLKSGIWSVNVKFGGTDIPISVLAYNDIEKRVCKCICKDPGKVMLWAQLEAAKMLFGCMKAQEAQKMIDRLYKDTECCCGCGGC